MTNIEAAEKFFEQVERAEIAKMFWIAGSFERSELSDFLDEIPNDRYNEIFPDADSAKYDRMDVLLARQLHGLIAEIHIPIASGFMFDSEGNPTSWSSSRGHCRVDYVYAETLIGLLNNIQLLANKHFNEFVTEAKK